MTEKEKTINVLGFHTSTLTRQEILQTVRQWITARTGSYHLMALNPIKVCRARKENDLADRIRSADILYPDAFGIAWAMSTFSGKKYPTIPGCDLMYDLMRMASENKCRVYLLGANEATVRQTAEIFRRDYPGANIVGLRNGYFKDDQEKQDTLNDIIRLSPDIVFVAMGALIQENWIEAIRGKARENSSVVPVCMGVGGSFDAVTGNVPRPPRWMLRMHLEWLFRLLQQPFRAPRMLALPHFALLVLAKKLLGVNTDHVAPEDPARKDFTGDRVLPKKAEA